MKPHMIQLKSTLDFITNLLLLFALIAALLLFIPRAMGMDTYTVLSSSMEPTLPVGSVIYTSPCSSLDQIEEQDIIAYEAGTVFVTHRAISVDRNTGGITTQGDANKVADQSPVFLADVIGKVRFYIPYLGYILMMLQERSGKLILFLAAALLLALSIVSGHVYTRGQSAFDQNPSRRNMYEEKNKQ